MNHKLFVGELLIIASSLYIGFFEHLHLFLQIIALLITSSVGIMTMIKLYKDLNRKS